MKSVTSLICLLLGILSCLVQVEAEVYATLTNDGPCVKGGTITFRADLFNMDGSRPSGTFSYDWTDNAIPSHGYSTEGTSNTTMYWTVNYPAHVYPIGPYEVQVIVSKKVFLTFWSITSRRGSFQITNLFNGNMTVNQRNKTLSSDYVASNVDTTLSIDIRKGDQFFEKNNLTDTATYWFIDCKYYGYTEDFKFHYKFDKADETHTVEALIVVTKKQPVTTTVAPKTTTTMPVKTMTLTVNGIEGNSTESSKLLPTESTPVLISLTSTSAPIPKSVSAAPSTSSNASFNVTDAKASGNRSDLPLGNTTFPFVCLNSSIISPDPEKTYGYFSREINVRSPIGNITVEGTNWIQPWDMLSLKVACQGSGPIYKCLEFHRGEYNVTGNEKCDEGEHLHTCNFSIIHYFLEPSVYTILVILDNDVSTLVYPLTINIYKVSTKPQLSVIVVPVSCSLAAVVLIIFGVAYYIQSRARFTVEVADFDFGQNNPEMEYKTFTERLRDSFNNTGYKQLSNPKTQSQEVPEEVHGIHQ